MAIEQAIFRRSELLLGDEAMSRIGEKRVIIFGVGGVGSWCAESLIRSGIRKLTIVDSDRVCITNINRQLMATTKTVGQVKVEALKERLLTINPSAEITALQQIFTAETAESFQLDSYDYIIDAIDSLKDKALLILMACQTKAKLFSSMGAALKLDKSRWLSSGRSRVTPLPVRSAIVLSATSSSPSASSSASFPTSSWKTKVITLLVAQRSVCVLRLRAVLEIPTCSITSGARRRLKLTARCHTSPPFSALCWQDWCCKMP